MKTQTTKKQLRVQTQVRAGLENQCKKCEADCLKIKSYESRMNCFNACPC